jgi:hypothetical protein
MHFENKTVVRYIPYQNVILNSRGWYTCTTTVLHIGKYVSLLPRTGMSTVPYGIYRCQLGRGK